MRTKPRSPRSLQGAFDSLRRTLAEMKAVPLSARAAWAGKTAAATAALVIAGSLFAERWQIRFDPQVFSCINVEFLLVDTKDREPRVGEIFAYRSKNAAPIYPDGTEMAKYVAAGPGDRVEITSDFRVLVNGVERARGLPHTGDMPLEAVRKRFCGARVLGDDEYWMLGTSFRSFDSRYWGPIRSEQIVGRAYVII